MGWKRSYERNQRLKKLSRIPAGTYYKDEEWVKNVGLVKIPKPYYIRYYRGNHKWSRYRYYKKYSNRIVRRFGEDIQNGSSYKKCFDYWWTVD